MAVKKVGSFQCTKPCKNCPYRIDAPLQLWDKIEFIKVLNSENDYLGSIFNCHKKNGSVCVGWLIKQQDRNFPSIQLRLSLTINNVSRAYLDKLKSPTPLYENFTDMIESNYPELLENKTPSF